MSEQVTLTIDGQQVTVPKGTLIIEAARKLGIEIPVYCYHPKLAPVGACRVCVVEVEKQRRPIMPACATEVAPDMVVHTRNEAATRAREGVLELLLINHPLDCPVCDRGGECDLQDFTLRYGPGKSRFQETKRHFDKSIQVGREVVLDRERCIMCMRCVRFCEEVAVEEGLTIIERGTKAEIGPFPGRSFDSQFSGNTVEICPVGALTSRSYRFRSRPWELQNFSSVCVHCAVGCNLTVDVRYDQVVRLRSRCNDAIDDGWLCDRGRYGYGFIHHPERLKTPLVRRNGELQPATWKEALEVAASGLKRVPAEKVGAVAGPRISNEAGWQLVRLLRSTLKSGNLDHRRGKAWTEEHRPLPLSAQIQGLDTATAVVLAHCDPSQTHPVLDLRIKKALRKGAQLLVLGDCGLSGYADFQLTDLATLGEAYAALGDESAPAIRHPRPRPWEPGGKASRDVQEAARALKSSPRVVLIFDENRPVAGLAELAEQIGALNQAPHGLMMLVSGANSVGLREMGVLPRFAPGWVGLDQARSSFEHAWGAFSSHVGLDYEAMTGSGHGLEAMLLVGENRLARKPEFLVAVDMVLSEAAAQADVVLPACSLVEQAMTMTSLDGTVQLCQQALPPQAESRPDWQILSELAAALGENWETDGSAKIFAEIGRLNPLYKGASYSDFKTEASQHWSYPQQGRIGTPRPDLSAIPATRPDAPPWVAAVPTGSRVERVARSLAGDAPPQVPGQADPRQVAAALGLGRQLEELPMADVEDRLDRIALSRSPQPPGPSPAERYHQVGVSPRESQPEAQPLAEEVASEEVSSQ